MAPLEESVVEKKLRSASTSQDSIQNLAMWIFHYKQQHEKIVDVWFKVLKKSKIEFRLVLYYLCNEIVQTCRKKHAVVYKDAFKEIMKDATLLVRDVSIKTNIERIYTIWGERAVYEQEFCDELITVLNNSKTRSTLNSKLVADFQPVVLMEKIITQKRQEDEMELKRRQLVNLRLDASSIEAVKQLKDRTHGKEFCAEFESACKKMEEFVGGLEKELQERTALIELLEQSELYYDSQYGEAKIVANAYRNFGNRVVSLAKKLHEKVPTLDDTPPGTPPGTPPITPADSPDPEPPVAEPIDDNLDLDLPGLGGLITQPSVSRSGGQETTETVDMDLSDGEGEKPVNGQAEEGEGQSPAPSDDSLADERPMGSPLIDSTGESKEMLSNLFSAASAASFMGTSQSVLQQIQNLAKPTYTGPSEGGSTPVMDEEMPDEDDQPPASSSEGTKTTRANPIDFLSQLIGGQQGSSKDSAITTSPFLQSLSELTSKAKTMYSEPGSAGDGFNIAPGLPQWPMGQGQPPPPPPGAIFPPPPMPAFISGGGGGNESFPPFLGGVSSPGFAPPPPPPAPDSMAQGGFPQSIPAQQQGPVHIPQTPPAPGASYQPPGPIPASPQTPGEHGLYPRPPPPPPASQGSWPHGNQGNFSPPPQPPGFPPPPPPLNHQHSDGGDFGVGRGGGILPPPPRPMFARPPGPPPGPPPPGNASPPGLGGQPSNGQEEFAEKLRRKTSAMRTLTAVQIQDDEGEDMEEEEEEEEDAQEFFPSPPPRLGAPFSHQFPHGLMRPRMRFDRFPGPPPPRHDFRPDFSGAQGKRPPPPPPFRPFRGRFPPPPFRPRY